MKVLKPTIKERINKKLQKIKSGKGREYFKINFGYPARTKELNKSSIIKYTKDIEKVLPDIKGLLDLFRRHISHVWNQDKFSASYLLICKAFGEINPILIIAREGSSHEVAELVRSGVEALDLAILFLEENDGVNLKKWFGGEIIGNEEARKMHDKVINKWRIDSKNIEVPLKDVKSDVYWVYSQFTHNAYSALLESIDLFYEDYDFKKYSGFHYMARSLHLIDDLIENILVSLKDVFLKLYDLKGFSETDRVMKKHEYASMSAKEIDKLFLQYRTKARVGKKVFA